VVGAAAVAPLVAALAMSPIDSPDRWEAGCMSWLGSMNDGTCMSDPNQNDTGTSSGLPQVQLGGPYSGNDGLTTGSLFPGRTFSTPLG
jgi:hypothetical protein